MVTDGSLLQRQCWSMLLQLSAGHRCSVRSVHLNRAIVVAVFRHGGALIDFISRDPPRCVRSLWLIVDVIWQLAEIILRCHGFPFALRGNGSVVIKWDHYESQYRHCKLRLVCVELNPGPVCGDANSSRPAGTAGPCQRPVAEVGSQCDQCRPQLKRQRNQQEPLDPMHRLNLFEVQRRNVVEFLGRRSSLHALSAFKFVHDQFLNVPVKHANQVKLKPSLIFPGIMGVFIESIENPPIEIPYEGWLLPNDLFDLLSLEYYCPTGVNMDQLSYNDQHGNTIGVTFLGDPTKLGPNVNSSDNITPRLPKSFGAKLIHHIPTALALTSSLRTINNPPQSSQKGLVYFEIKPTSHQIQSITNAEPGTVEIVFQYEQGESGNFFGNKVDDSPHCDVCMSKFDGSEGLSSIKKVTNPLIFCSVLKCNLGRHRDCFDIPPSLASIKTMEHRCAMHRSIERPRRSLQQQTQETESTPSDNYPRQRTLSARGKVPVFLDSTFESEALKHNSKLQNCEVRPSTTGQDGLFTVVEYKAPSRSSGRRAIGSLWGCIVSSKRHDRLVASAASMDCVALTTGEKEFVADIRIGIHRSIDIQDSIGDSILLISRQCPGGKMNDARGAENCIVAKVSFPIKDLQLCEATGSLDVDTFVYSIDDIDVAAGTELFLDYGWTQAMWTTVLSHESRSAVAKTQSAEQSVVGASSSSSSRVRPSLVVDTSVRPTDDDQFEYSPVNSPLVRVAANAVVIPIDSPEHFDYSPVDSPLVRVDSNAVVMPNDSPEHFDYSPVDSPLVRVAANAVVIPIDSPEQFEYSPVNSPLVVVPANDVVMPIASPTIRPSLVIATDDDQFEYSPVNSPFAAAAVSPIDVESFHLIHEFPVVEPIDDSSEHYSSSKGTSIDLPLSDAEFDHALRKLIDEYLSAYSDPPVMTLNQRLNTHFLLSHMALPVGTPSHWIAAIESHKQLLKPSLVGIRSCQKRLTFDARSCRVQSSSSVIVPIMTSLPLLEQLRANLPLPPSTKIHSLTESVSELTDALIDDWITFCISGWEQSFISNLAIFIKLFDDLTSESMSTLYQVQSPQRRELIVQLMYLGTHIIFAQTDYMSRLNENVIGLGSISKFLLVAADIVTKSKSQGYYSEVIAECVIIFRMTPDYLIHAARFWRDQVLVITRMPQANSTVVRDRVDSSHLLCVLFQLYCTSIIYPINAAIWRVDLSAHESKNHRASLIQLYTEHPELSVDAMVVVKSSGVVRSVGQEVDLGLFTTASFKKDEKITLYGGTPVQDSHLQSQSREFKSHAMRVPGSNVVLDGRLHSRVFTRPIVGGRPDSSSAAFLPHARFGESTIRRVMNEPKGYMVNTSSDIEQINCRWITFQQIGAQGLNGSVHVLAPLRAIPSNTELIAQYHNHFDEGRSVDMNAQFIETSDSSQRRNQRAAERSTQSSESQIGRSQLVPPPAAASNHTTPDDSIDDDFDWSEDEDFSQGSDDTGNENSSDEYALERSSNIGSVRVAAKPMQESPVGSAANQPLRFRSREDVTSHAHWLAVDASVTHRKQIAAWISASRIKSKAKKLSDADTKAWIDRALQDYEEIQMCCGPTYRDGYSFVNHPFQDCMSMIKLRLDKQSNLKGFTQFASEALRNQSPATRSSANEPSRSVMLCSVPICQSCFRAFLGKSIRTVRALKALNKSARCELQNDSVLSGNKPVVVDLVVNELMILVRVGQGDPLPTERGGSVHLERQFLMFPYSSKRELMEEVTRRIRTKIFGFRMTQGTFYRALKKVRAEKNIVISCAKTKEFMQCTTCHTLNNERENVLAMKDGDAMSSETKKQELRKVAHKKSIHLEQVTAERNYYESTKATAMSDPSKVMVLTIDGMDQAKTVLPHLKRDSKASNPDVGLGTHVVSVVKYGADDPINGFVNLQDISKNSSLTVTLINESLVRSWNAHLAKNDGRLENWPERLHICFDNAVGENINSNVLHYLGALVHHGVFLSITIGTFFVGHTHNINDQVFSVWSRWIKPRNVYTLSEMMAGFADNYKGNMNAKAAAHEKAAQDAARDGDAVPMILDQDDGHVEDVADDEQSYDLKNVPVKVVRQPSMPAAMGPIGELPKNATPTMHLVNQNADIGGWIGAQHFKDNPFDRLFTKYHIYAFTKDFKGDTVMHYKFCTNSEDTYIDKPHNEVLDDVKYRGVTRIFKADESIIHDPLAFPFNVVDTKTTEKLIQTLAEGAAMSDIQRAEMSGLCAKLHSQVEDQEKLCKVCNDAIKGLAEVGVISRVDNPTDANKLQTAQAQSKRNHHHDSLDKHLAEPDAATKHPHLLMTGFWTDWINIRIPLIKAHYDSRSLDNHPHPTFSLANTGRSAATDGRTSHPDDFSREEGKKVIRGEVLRMQLVGPPRVNSIAILRSTREATERGQPEFWLAKVIDHRCPSANELKAEAAFIEKSTYNRLKNIAKKNGAVVQFEIVEALEDLVADDPYSVEDTKRRAKPGGEVEQDSNCYLQWKAKSCLPHGKPLPKDRLHAISEQENSNVFTYSHIRIEYIDHHKTDADLRADAEAPAAPAAVSSSRRRINLSDRIAENGDEYVPPSAAPAASSSSSSRYQREIAAEEELIVDPAQDSHQCKTTDVEKWRDLKYATTSAANNGSQSSWVPVGQLIWWGSSKDTFLASKNRARSLKKNVFDKVLTDLTMYAVDDQPAGAIRKFQRFSHLERRVQASLAIDLECFASRRVKLSCEQIVAHEQEIRTRLGLLGK